MPKPPRPRPWRRTLQVQTETFPRRHPVALRRRAQRASPLLSVFPDDGPQGPAVRDLAGPRQSHARCTSTSRPPANGKAPAKRCHVFRGSSRERQLTSCVSLTPNTTYSLTCPVFQWPVVFRYRSTQPTASLGVRSTSPTPWRPVRPALGSGIHPTRTGVFARCPLPIPLTPSVSPRTCASNCHPTSGRGNLRPWRASRGTPPGQDRK